MRCMSPHLYKSAALGGYRDELKNPSPSSSSRSMTPKDMGRSLDKGVTDIFKSRQLHTVQLSIGGKDGEIEGKIEGIIFRTRGQKEGI